ncbi:MAG: hypothetical protein CL609_03550 [Anaerolineaceae bacterium]|nr:hypothetical protein [Anaerolineaceae bacterium]
MADVFLFVRHGWKSIWKQKTIWLFSVLPFLNLVFIDFQVGRDADLLPQLIASIFGFFLSILYFVSIIGVPYLAYRFLIGESATIQETLSAVKKFFGRALGCTCLGVLVLSPIFLWVLATSIDRSIRGLEYSDYINLVFLPLSIFSSLWTFTFAAFFENDWGIRKSLDKAWKLFKSHFSVLAVLGLMLEIIFYAFSILSDILTVLIQSGFDITTINNFNIFNPTALLNKNLLFVLINGIGQIIFTPLRASIYVSAYLKYSNVKLPFLIRVR